jgi:hypothetical protein
VKRLIIPVLALVALIAAAAAIVWHPSTKLSAGTAAIYSCIASQLFSEDQFMKPPRSLVGGPRPECVARTGAEICSGISPKELW